jgi:hypothetical protein
MQSLLMTECVHVAQAARASLPVPGPVSERLWSVLGMSGVRCGVW